MVVTDDEELALKIRRFNSLGYAAVGSSAGDVIEAVSKVVTAYLI